MRLGLRPIDAAAVVVSAVGIYVAFLVLLRSLGQRVLAGMAGPDIATTAAIGAVLGRTVLGYTPTLAAGMLGTCTLLALQGLALSVRRFRRIDRLLSSAPVLLMVDGRIVPGQLRVARLVEDELRQKLRLAGIGRYEDVGVAVLERTGGLSVIRRGVPVSPDLLAGVCGAEFAPAGKAAAAKNP